MRPEDEMVGAQMTEYTPDSIREVAEVLAPQAGNYTNALTSQIGQAQQSMGPLAAATMGTPVQGLGNYTYNRLVRPQVDTMRDELLVQGYTNSLNKMLSDRLRAARDNYNRSGSGSGSNKSSSGTNDDVENEYTDGNSGSDNKTDTSKKTDTVSTLPSTAKKGEQNVGSAVVGGETRIVTKDDRGWYHIQGVGSWRPGSQEWNNIKNRYNVKLTPYPGQNPLLTFGAM